MQHEKWWTSEVEIARCDICNSLAVAWKCWKGGSSLARKVVEMEMNTEGEPDFFLCASCYERVMNGKIKEWELYGFEFAERVT